MNVNDMMKMFNMGDNGGCSDSRADALDEGFGVVNERGLIRPMVEGEFQWFEACRWPTGWSVIKPPTYQGAS